MKPSTEQPAQIVDPRRALFLGSFDSGILSLIKELTGSAPDPLIIPAKHINHADTKPHESDASHDGLPAAPFDPQRLEYDADASDVETVATVAGLSHTLSLRTKYYNATVPVWIDQPTDTETWCADFKSPDAGEVVRSVGAWVMVFREERSPRRSSAARGRSPVEDGKTPVAVERKASRRNGRDDAVKLMHGVRDAIETAHGGSGIWDGVCLAVRMPATSSSTVRSQAAREEGGGELRAEDEEAEKAWDDLCYDLGFEYIDCGVASTSVLLSEENANGREKTGVARVLEALETCDWESLEDDPLHEDDAAESLVSLENETLGFGLERAQMEAEFVGLRGAMLSAKAGEPGHTGAEEDDSEEAVEVEELESMMQKMIAVRDMSAHMPEQERRRLAARTVNEIMKTM